MVIDFLGLERIPHIAYSPDLAPMDFAAFPRLKADLRGSRFDQLPLAMRPVIEEYGRQCYRNIFNQIWVGRHQKCTDLNDVYFEKE